MTFSIKGFSKLTYNVPAVKKFMKSSLAMVKRMMAQQSSDFLLTWLSYHGITHWFLKALTLDYQAGFGLIQVNTRVWNTNTNTHTLCGDMPKQGHQI